MARRNHFGVLMKKRVLSDSNGGASLADYIVTTVHLDEISRAVAAGAHAVLLLDRAGWHTTSKLDVPDNITPIFLPSRAPELNPVENVWQYLRQNWLSNTVFETTTRSSTPHAKPGEISSSPKPSPPSECATGLTSVSRHDPWYEPHRRTRTAEPLTPCGRATCAQNRRRPTR
jgi:hypothetical protein